MSGIRTHTLNNSKVMDFPITELSKAITRLYATDRGLFGQFEGKLLSGDYVTPMIYFVKRCLITFEEDLLFHLLEDLRDEMHKPLYLSFLARLERGDTHAFSMYLVKNRHIDYVKD